MPDELLKERGMVVRNVRVVRCAQSKALRRRSISTEVVVVRDRHGPGPAAGTRPHSRSTGQRISVLALQRFARFRKPNEHEKLAPTRGLLRFQLPGVTVTTQLGAAALVVNVAGGGPIVRMLTAPRGSTVYANTFASQLADWCLIAKFADGVQCVTTLAG